MARRKKNSKKRERIPVIDFLIDMAAAATLDHIAYKRRQKCHNRRSNKIDPYEATGIAMGLGHINSTEDLIKFGGMLGAMGAFDQDDELYINSETYSAPRDNRYAWRLNCEDGSEYGIDPSDYETRNEYLEALKAKKESTRIRCEKRLEPQVVGSDKTCDVPSEEVQAVSTGDKDSSECVCISCGTGKTIPKSILQKRTKPHPIPTMKIDEYEDEDFHVYIYCNIELLTTHEQKYYRTEDRSLKKGDTVAVPDPISRETLRGKILSVEHHMSFSVPQPVKETDKIIGPID